MFSFIIDDVKTSAIVSNDEERVLNSPLVKVLLLSVVSFNEVTFEISFRTVSTSSSVAFSLSVDTYMKIIDIIFLIII